MEIKRITDSDSKNISDIAKIHYTVLTESFLNHFGLKFLEIIYQNLSGSKGSIVLISKENQDITGYLLAVTDYSKFFEIAISKKKFLISILVLKTLITKPSLAYKLISSLLKVSKEEPHTELQFIAISPAHQGQNLGTKLIEQLNKELEKISVKKYFVGTKSENELSNKFYLKLGFSKVYTKTYFGDELNYYISPEI